MVEPPQPPRETMVQRVADALDAKGVVAEVLPAESRPHLSTLVLGGAEAWFKLSGEDIDLLHVVGSDGEDSHLARYLVGDVNASRETFAEFKPKRKGLFGLGGVAGYEWKGPELAKVLNDDPFLRDKLITSGYRDLSVWPEGQDLIAIHQVHVMQARQIADFLRPANMIAKVIRRIAR